MSRRCSTGAGGGTPPTQPARTPAFPSFGDGLISRESYLINGTLATLTEEKR